MIDLGAGQVDVQIRVDREFDRYPDGSAERGELIRDVVRDVARALNLTEPPGADRLLPISIAPGSVVRIEGLLGAKTPDSDSLAVTGVRVVPVGRWRRADGDRYARQFFP